jgi:hypothetical protein
MMTAPQLTANRANSLLSTGPTTESGKLRSSQNSVKHGLCGKIHAATREDQAAFDLHCHEFREALAPVGLVEPGLVQAIAEDAWRLKRARALENSIFAKGPDAAADTGNPEIDAALDAGQTWIEQARNLQLLTLYEQRINRTLAKNTASLEALQSTRKAAFAQAQAEAMLLAEWTQSQGEVYDPALDFPPSEYFGGFVYATAEIARLIDRARRLDAAKSFASQAGNSPFNRQAPTRRHSKAA